MKNPIRHAAPNPVLRGRVPARLKHESLGLADIRRTYRLWTWDDAQLRWVADDRLGRWLDLHEGNVLLDGAPVPRPRFNSHQVNWSHERDGAFTSGTIAFENGTLWGFGSIAIGDSAAPGCHREWKVFAGIPLTVYRTRYARDGIARTPALAVPDHLPERPPDDPERWVDGPSFHLGFRSGGSDESMPQGIWQWSPPGRDDEQHIMDVSDLGLFTLKAVSNALELDFDGSSVVSAASPPLGDGGMDFGASWPFACQFLIDARTDALRGWIQLTSTSSLSGETTGEKVPLIRYFEGGDESAERVSARRGARLSGAPEATFSASQPSGLSLMELCSINPASADVQSRVNSILTSMMKWSISQPGATAPWSSSVGAAPGFASNDETRWVEMFWGQDPATLALTSAQIALAQGAPDFYRKRFAPAFLGSSLNGIKEAVVTTHLTTAQSVDLDFFFRAGLAADKDYNVQSQGVFEAAFVAADSTGRLDPYLADYEASLDDQGESADDDPRNWPKRLYDWCLTPQQLNLTVNSIVASSGDMAEVTARASVLSTFNLSGRSKVNWGQKYYCAVTAAMFAKFADGYDWTNGDEIRSWMPDVIQAFIARNIDGNNPDLVDPQLRAEAQAQAQALQDAIEKGKGLLELSDAITDAIVEVYKYQTSTEWLTDLDKCQTALQKKGYVGIRCLGALMMIGSLLCLIWAFQTEGGRTADEPIPEKGMFIAGAIGLAGEFLALMPDLIRGGSFVVKWIANRTIAWAKAVWNGGVQWALASEVEMVPIVVAERAVMAGAGSMARAAAARTELSWGAAFVKSFPKVLVAVGKAAMVLVSLGVAVFTAWQFIDDLRDGAPGLATVCDGIIALTSAAFAICTVLEICFSLSWAPAVGAVAAAIGVVVALVEIFAQPQEQGSPAELTMQGFASCFANQRARAGDAFILRAPDDWDRTKPVPSGNDSQGTPINPYLVPATA